MEFKLEFDIEWDFTTDLAENKSKAHMDTIHLKQVLKELSRQIGNPAMSGTLKDPQGPAERAGVVGKWSINDS